MKVRVRYILRQIQSGTKNKSLAFKQLQFQFSKHLNHHGPKQRLLRSVKQYEVIVDAYQNQITSYSKAGESSKSQFCLLLNLKLKQGESNMVFQDKTQQVKLLQNIQKDIILEAIIKSQQSQTNFHRSKLFCRFQDSSNFSFFANYILISSLSNCCKSLYLCIFYYNNIYIVLILSNLIMKNPILLLCILFTIISQAQATSQYRVISTEASFSTIILGLRYIGNQDYYIKPTSSIVKDLIFTIRAHAVDDFYFKITDIRNSRFEVPQDDIFPTDPMRNFTYPLNFSNIQFTYNPNPFDFSIRRKSTNTILFSTFQGEIIFSDYYLEITTQLSSIYTYGLGERFSSSLKVKSGKWTIYNKEKQGVIDQGTAQQSSGYYPFYLQRDSKNYFHINYFRTSSPMDVVKFQQNSRNYLKFQVIGGLFDFRFFLAETPQATLQKFHLYLGKSLIPPFWSLGFHQSRWGYSNVVALQRVIQGYQQNGLPLDAIWSDIDYMVNAQVFTFNQADFPLYRMSNILYKYHYIPVINPGIGTFSQAYEEGKKRGVFIKDADGAQLQGKHWPGPSTFVDFFHPNSSSYWADMLNLLYSKVNFSGIWLNMNQYTHFCNGTCQASKSWPRFDYTRDLPVNIGSDSIQFHTIPLNSTHYGNRKQADVHAYNGFLQTYATYQFLKSKNMRPFINTRSSTIGTNKYGFHSTGNNNANFKFLKNSITDILLNQMWGFQMVGSDICGYSGNTTEQLCSRWFQLGSLYTFSRNHNEYYSKSQQPYALGQIVLATAKNSLKLRYSLLKHYYSLFILKRGIGAILNPIFFIFPEDQNSYIDTVADTQFLIGNNLIVIPFVDQGTNYRTGYLPRGNWYEFSYGTHQAQGFYNFQNAYPSPLPMYLYEGTMVLTQNSDNVMNTKDLGSTFTLVAAFIYKEASNQYISNGKHISLSDYNNNNNIDSCVYEGCFYEFHITYSPSQSKLSIDITYNGPSKLNERIQINELKLYHYQFRVLTKLQNPIAVEGTGEIVIPNVRVSSQEDCGKKLNQLKIRTE